MLDGLGGDKNSAMLRGHNSDLQVRGKSYHVQTEDWGAANPFLVSRIYCNGAVVKTFKTPHEEALKDSSVSYPEALRQALHRQHARVVDSLLAGELF